MVRQAFVRKTREPGSALGPNDEGRMLTERQYLRCTDAPGYVAEIFDGVVHVSPSPIPDHDIWRSLLVEHLTQFGRRNPALGLFVSTDNDVVVPFRPGPTRPRPDIAAYSDFRLKEQLGRGRNWSDFCPVLVIEIISRRRGAKDIARNRRLYWTAGGIGEYAIVDPRKQPRRPGMAVLARRSGEPDWIEHHVPFGESYESVMLPGLSINLERLLDNG